MMPDFDWQPCNGYLMCDPGTYRLFVSRVGNMYRWQISKEQRGIFLPVNGKYCGYCATPVQAQHECETAYRAEVARG